MKGNLKNKNSKLAHEALGEEIIILAAQTVPVMLLTSLRASPDLMGPYSSFQKFFQFFCFPE